MPTTTSSPLLPSLSSLIKLSLPCSSSSYHPPTLSASRLLFLPCNVVPRCSRTPSASSIRDDSQVSNSGCCRGLVLGLGEGQSWDNAEVGSPVVKRFLSDDGERWYMWYHGRRNRGSDSSTDCIGLAVSNDGISWERGEGAASSVSDVGRVMSCSNDWWCFDTAGVRPSDVLVMSSSMVRGSGGGVYWMYYTGYSGDYEPEGFFKSLLGLAMSQDGRHWARIEGEHHSGALFDVGLENEWDSLFVASPRVVFHRKGDLRMYYHLFDAKAGEFCVGMAGSRDGMRWTKAGKVTMDDGGGSTDRKGRFDEKGAVNVHVVRKRGDGRYVMAYEGVGGDGRRRIGIAVTESEDGVKGWRRVGDGVLEGSGEDGWDGVGVGWPYLVEMDGGEWRLYYGGLSHGGVRSPGIGLATTSHPGDFTSFCRFG